jgi:hypothetical protein
MKRKNRRLFYKGAVVNPVPEIQALLASAGTKSLHYVQAICSLLPETDDIQSSLEGYCSDQRGIRKIRPAVIS